MALDGTAIIGYAHALETAPEVLSGGGQTTTAPISLTVTREMFPRKQRTFQQAIGAQLKGEGALGQSGNGRRRRPLFHSPRHRLAPPHPPSTAHLPQPEWLASPTPRLWTADLRTADLWTVGPVAAARPLPQPPFHSPPSTALRGDGPPLPSPNAARALPSARSLIHPRPRRRHWHSPWPAGAQVGLDASALGLSERSSEGPSRTWAESAGLATITKSLEATLTRADAPEDELFLREPDKAGALFRREGAPRRAARATAARRCCLPP